jgi:hypothetical protein
MAYGPVEWPDCECGRAKVNLWAAEGLCSPCTRTKLGAVEFERRYIATRGMNGSWRGPDASIDALAGSPEPKET